MPAPADGEAASTLQGADTPRNDGVEVSVLVPVRNEAAGIRETVAAMRAQRFAGGLEFIFVDGRSEDQTRVVLDELGRGDRRIRVLDNPAREIVPALNTGLAHARGRFMARMDAHTLYPPGYIASGVARMQRDDVECVSGPQIPHGIDKGSRRIELALRSPLGVGGSPFRRPLREEVETDGAFTGLWRRETLERLGGWDATWLVNEDGELAARLRAAGGRYVCIPEMAARYVPRRTIRALARQYWWYGQYRAKTCGRHPESIRRSHLLPPAVTLAMAASAVPARAARPLRAAVALYGATLVAESSRVAVRAKRSRDAVFVAAALATMHLSWGSGFVVGSVRFGPPVGAVARAISPRRRLRPPVVGDGTVTGERWSTASTEPTRSVGSAR